MGNLLTIVGSAMVAFLAGYTCILVCIFILKARQKQKDRYMIQQHQLQANDALKHVQQRAENMAHQNTADESEPTINN